MSLTNYQILKDSLLFSAIGILIYLLMSGFGISSKNKSGNDTTIVYERTTIIRDTTITQGQSTPAPKIYVTTNVSNDSLISILKSFQARNNYVQLDTNCKTINTYNDTLQNDSNAFIAVYDTTQGQLLNRRKHIKIYGKTVYHEKTIEIKKPEWHLHLGAYGGINSFTPNLIYTSKKKFEVGAGYDILQKQTRIYVGYELK
jgi:hypothetical protein